LTQDYSSKRRKVEGLNQAAQPKIRKEALKRIISII
jgi:hypothetical protein